jgi:8-oxo-dGTP pyrophosphatase MutT (NUDIX family)
MPGRNTATRPARTVLELRIRQRRQTFEEFSEYVEVFAREHGEKGTLSTRHLQRLAAGFRPGGTPLGPTLRPATTRLLERIFDTNIEELLAAPDEFDPIKGLTTPPPAVRVLEVAVAVVVKGSDVLIVCRRGGDANGISWQFPAGMVKPGMEPGVVAVRETLAETGVHCLLIRGLGSRVHPITNVLCDYLLCEYMGGEAKNMDLAENVDLTWADKTTLTRYIPAKRIFPPVLETLEYGSGLKGTTQLSSRGTPRH